MKKLFLATFLSLWASLASATGSIVLVVDISTSINEEQLDLQFDSYQKAMLEISYLENVNIEVVLFDNKIYHISSGTRQSAAEAFASFPRANPAQRGTTCLTSALLFVESMLPSLPQPVIIDISGDGEANCDNREQIHPTLDRIANTGARVNTLYIENRKFDEQYTRTNADYVTPLQFYQNLTRNDGFTEFAESFFDFELALFEKLILEVAQLREM